ncbi:phosphotransferase [Kribbella sp. NPDC026611]|uniref:phosphotransferase enzyme family protein n=1 Tax=Kribbella sp. NPDC026611 TaxID=3154911 RepID=UPI0033FEFDF8
MWDGARATLVEALRREYGVRAAEVTRIVAGTVTTNFRVEDDAGRQWFVKVYRDRGTLGHELAAVELAGFARAGGVPVPAVLRSAAGGLICDSLPMSVWEFVQGDTAESGIAGGQWAAIGGVVGRLHRRLAAHPLGRPTLMPGVVVRDVGRAQEQFDRVIARHGEAAAGSYEGWAVAAATERRELLPRVEGILAGLPELAVQVVHGDLASPNVLLDGDRVVGVIDFQPPGVRSVAWEISRIALDPRTVLLGDEWVSGLAKFLDAYRAECPGARAADLEAVVAVGCAYLLASSYPLLERPTPALEMYARARHEAGLVLLQWLKAQGL